MKEPLQDFRYDKSAYERLTHPWVCGWAAEGRACRVGPDRTGRCRAAYECVPVRKGDRWACARPQSEGGPCDDGPLPDGTCCKPIPPCQPVRSLRARRGLVTSLVLAFTFGLLLLYLTSPNFSVPHHLFVLPGELAIPHAAVQCAACHIAAKVHTPRELLAALTTDPQMADSQLCFTCHKKIGNQALKPHGLPPQALAPVTERITRTYAASSAASSVFAEALGAGALPNERGDVACAPCHLEHRGKTVRLTKMDNEGCQGCHVYTFLRFTDDHPEFTDYPAQQHPRWQFNHLTHEKERFPTKSIAFTCTHCHLAAPSGRNILVEPFEKTCTGCHLEQIQRGKGIAVLSLPGVDIEMLLDHGIEIGEWPGDANLDLEEDPTPFMKLLLSQDPKVANDLNELERAGVHLYDLEHANARQIAAAGRVVWAVKGLYYDLLSRGRTELVARLNTVAGAVLKNQDLAALTGQTSDVPEWLAPVTQPPWLSQLQAAQQRWLPSVMTEVPLYRAGRTVRFKEQAVKATGQRNDERENLRGEWSSLDKKFTIFYRPTRHDDPFIRAWIGLAGRLYGTKVEINEVFDTLTSSAPDTPGQCMKCHKLADAQPQRARSVDWSETLPTSERAATVFTHGPHLALKDCQACHAFHAEHDFKPIVKATCAECHTGTRAGGRARKQAGDNCLMCHKYHVGPPTS